MAHSSLPSFAGAITALSDNGKNAAIHMIHPLLSHFKLQLAAKELSGWALLANFILFGSLSCSALRHQRQAQPVEAFWIEVKFTSEVSRRGQQPRKISAGKGTRVIYLAGPIGIPLVIR
jgi:hypothetical protein